MEIPERVAPARSGLPPRGALERGRSDVGLSERGRSELLCGRDELLLEDGLPLVGRPDDGLPLEERPDVEPPLDGLDGGREPFEGGRRDSMSVDSIPSGTKLLPSTINKENRKGALN